MNITTKTGDKGETSLYAGGRVSKADPVIDLLGELDELQVLCGLAKFDEKGEERFSEVLERVQDDLYRMMSVVGFKGKLVQGIKDIGSEDVEFLEAAMKEYEEQYKDLRKFIRPATTVRAGRLHHARAVCRRAERKFVGSDISHECVLKYLNRLSDLLFVFGFVSEKD